MLPEGFEPSNPAGERPQTHALDRGAYQMYLYLYKIIKSLLVTKRTPRFNAKYSAFFFHTVFFIIRTVKSSHSARPDLSFSDAALSSATIRSAIADIW